MSFIPYQAMHSITLRESGYKIILVLPYPLDEVRCYAYVQGAVRSACKYVDAGDFRVQSLWIPATTHRHSCPVDSRFRGNDGMGARESTGWKHDTLAKGDRFPLSRE